MSIGGQIEPLSCSSRDLLRVRAHRSRSTEREVNGGWRADNGQQPVSWGLVDSVTADMQLLAVAGRNTRKSSDKLSGVARSGAERTRFLREQESIGGVHRRFGGASTPFSVRRRCAPISKSPPPPGAGPTPGLRKAKCKHDRDGVARKVVGSSRPRRLALLPQRTGPWSCTARLQMHLQQGEGLSRSVATSAEWQRISLTATGEDQPGAGGRRIVLRIRKFGL